MNNTGTRRCSYILCCCTQCPNVVRVKRVRVEVGGRTISMTGPGYMQYQAVMQEKAWARFDY